jgi:hypothetical protein
VLNDEETVLGSLSEATNLILFKQLETERLSARLRHLGCLKNCPGGAPCNISGR